MLTYLREQEKSRTGGREARSAIALPEHPRTGHQRRRRMQIESSRVGDASVGEPPAWTIGRCGDAAMCGSRRRPRRHSVWRVCARLQRRQRRHCDEQCSHTVLLSRCLMATRVALFRAANLTTRDLELTRVRAVDGMLGDACDRPMVRQSLCRLRRRLRCGGDGSPHPAHGTPTPRRARVSIARPPVRRVGRVC
jgi:hypothetical protein